MTAEPEASTGGRSSAALYTLLSVMFINMMGFGVIVPFLPFYAASFHAAQRACAKYAPNGGKAPSPDQQAKMVAQALKFSECMRAHGISDFPDPQVSSGAGGVSIGIRSNGKGQSSDLNPSSPQFQAAQKVCQPLMGAAPGTTRSSDVAS